MILKAEQRHTSDYFIGSSLCVQDMNVNITLKENAARVDL